MNVDIIHSKFYQLVQKNNNFYLVHVCVCVCLSLSISQKGFGKVLDYCSRKKLRWQCADLLSYRREGYWLMNIIAFDDFDSWGMSHLWINLPPFATFTLLTYFWTILNHSSHKRSLVSLNQAVTEEWGEGGSHAL